MKTIIGFKNTLILTEDGIKKTNLIIKDGIIYSIGENIVDGLIELDDNKIVIPGLIDQHIHGASSYDVIDCSKKDIYKIACAIAEEGITSFLPTTTTQKIEVIEQALSTINDYMKDHYNEGAEVLGIHLEGPFISKKYIGAQLSNYILKPSVDTFKHFEKFSNNIKLVTLAIEEEGAVDLIKYLKNKNIAISIGHSASKYTDIEKMIKLGVTCFTHTYNGMRSIHHREIGTVGAALMFDELYCELICDGIHVSKPAVKLLCKNKPIDKLILVTDALRTKNMPNGIYEELEQTIILNNNEVRLKDGTLAGSNLKLNEAIKNIISYTNIDFITAIKYATENPAKHLGLFDQIGSIKENKQANFAVIDKELNVYQTIRNGKIIYEKEEKNEIFN